MVIEYINEYLKSLNNLLNSKKIDKFYTIGEYLNKKGLIETEILNKQKIEDVILQYISIDRYVQKGFYSVIERVYKNEIIGLNISNTNFTKEFHKDIIDGFSKNKIKFQTFTNAYELLFLF
ncbi:MAG: hypothetical protein ACRC34_03810, partial [Cetobacterium sp.]